MKDTDIHIFEMQAEICKTMADTSRLMILHELRDGERSVGQLVEELHLQQSNVSKHLGILRERGIVNNRREGTSVYYSLANPRIADACDIVQEVLKTNLQQNQLLAKAVSKRNR